jgi:formate hydrogenlyase subunit 3/multisubunit Na+/H+ antiporter MnhD subunit
VLALFMLGLGLAAGPVAALAARAAEQLADPAAYVHAVLGTEP